MSLTSDSDRSKWTKTGRKMPAAQKCKITTMTALRAEKQLCPKTHSFVFRHTTFPPSKYTKDLSDFEDFGLA